MGVEWIDKKHRGGSTGPAKGVLLSKAKQYRGKKHRPMDYLQVRFGEDVMKACRFVVGDYVRVGVDTEAGELYIKRTLDVTAGYRLTSITTHGKKYSEMLGKSVAATFRIPVGDQLQSVFPNGVARYQADHAAAQDGLIISLEGHKQ